MGSSARTHENTEGFTLIEILIMMVILSFVATPAVCKLCSRSTGTS